MIQCGMRYPAWIGRFKNAPLLHSVSMYHQHRSRFYISRVFPSRSHRSSNCHRDGTRGQFCHRTLFPSPERFPFRIYTPRHPIERCPIQTNPGVRCPYCITRCTDQCLLSDNHCYCEPDGSHRIGFFGCCRENYCFCHVAPNGHILCRSHNDGTKLWCRTHTENEPMPSFRHRARSHFRSYGLPVLAILAGNTYGLFLQRPCGNIDGSRIFERIQHRLCHRQLCVLYQFLFQRARQLTVSNDTQFDSDFPVSYSAFILVQPNRQFLTVYHGICTPALNNRITPDMYMVFEIHKR